MHKRVNEFTMKSIASTFVILVSDHRRLRQISYSWWEQSEQSTFFVFLGCPLPFWSGGGPSWCGPRQPGLPEQKPLRLKDVRIPYHGVSQLSRQGKGACIVAPLKGKLAQSRVTTTPPQNWKKKKLKKKERKALPLQHDSIVYCLYDVLQCTAFTLPKVVHRRFSFPSFSHICCLS